MPTGAHLAAFAVTAAVLIAIPGPSVLFTVGRALSVGRRAALLNVLGNASGVFAQVIAVALGLGAVVASSATVYAAIKLVGAGYIVFLDPDRGAVPLQIAVLGLIFTAIALVLDSTWALTASAARTWFARSPRRLARINAGGGGLIIGLGIHVALSGRPD
jgi:threonine/homoserine/homoserine lactone efflux protein